MKHQLNRVAVTPVVQAAAYATGDVMGGLMTFTGALPGGRSTIITGLAILCKVAPGATDLYIFNENPTATTFTENGAIALNVADLPKLVHGEAFSAGVFSNMGGTLTFASKDVSIPVAGVAGGTDLFAVLVARGATTFTGVADITVRITTDNN